MSRAGNKNRKKEELRYRLWFKVIDALSSIINKSVPWAGALGITYFVSVAIRSLAGRMTFASILVKFLADLKVSRAVAYLFGLGGVVYGVRQRRLRKDNIERNAGRIKSLETQLDPRRSSSRLTKRGETRPEDKS